MLEIKRKPNSPVGRATATATGRALTEASVGAPDAPHLIEHQSVHPVSCVTTPSQVQKRNPPLIAPPKNDAKNHATKLPIVIGEVECKGSLSLDGIALGQLGGSGGSLNVRQRAKSVYREPEFSGELSFRDTVRVNGYIAGTVYSKKGTLIVDLSARVDAHVDVAVAIIGGIVNGDVVAHERVEIGPGAKIYGNIWTRSIEIKNGAIFEGVCTMIPEEKVAG